MTPRLVVRVLQDAPALYQAEMTLQSGLIRPPMHRHPEREERIDVRDGTLTVRLGHRDSPPGARQAVGSVPAPGTPRSTDPVPPPGS